MLTGNVRIVAQVNIRQAQCIADECGKLIDTLGVTPGNTIVDLQLPRIVGHSNCARCFGKMGQDPAVTAGQDGSGSEGSCGLSC
jgi:hypothetical protein